METDVARGDYVGPRAGKETVAAVGERWDETVNAITDCHPVRLRLVPVLMAGCGLRINEALAVCEDDFDFDRHILHVRRQIKPIKGIWLFALPKNDRERDVPLPGWVEAIALQHFRLVKA